MIMQMKMNMVLICTVSWCHWTSQCAMCSCRCDKPRQRTKPAKEAT
jgi:hypothetical protein